MADITILPVCTCAEVYGENPRCAQHGFATQWSLESTTPEEWQNIALDDLETIAMMDDQLTTLRVQLAEAVAALRRYGEHRRHWMQSRGLPMHSEQRTRDMAEGYNTLVQLAHWLVDEESKRGDARNKVWAIHASNQVYDLTEACRLLIEQYCAHDNFTLGGALTNEPFLEIIRVLNDD